VQTKRPPGWEALLLRTCVRLDPDAPNRQSPPNNQEVYQKDNDKSEYDRIQRVNHFIAPFPD
jgi:hypothetical protein